MNGESVLRGHQSLVGISSLGLIVVDKQEIVLGCKAEAFC